jgi:CheY-like chemotaxis protein
MTKIKALVVEDDLDIRDEVEDALGGVLDHDHDWAESQQEARELLESNDYAYALVDLEIPARTGRGFAKIEYGRKLIGQIQQIKGRGVIPVILMTGHHRHGLNLVRELFDCGVRDFISKPFGDGTEGKSLPEVIQDVLDQHRKLYPPGTLPTDPPKRFEGGTLAYYPNHIELDGETILESGGPGHAWAIMQLLRQPRGNGKLPHVSARRLALAIDRRNTISEDAINSCVHSLRERIAKVMIDRANVTVGRDDVIANLGQGYHLAAGLTLETHVEDEAEPASTRGHRAETSTAMSMDISPNVHASSSDVLLTDRQHWVLDQLRDDVTLTRKSVEDEFGIGQKQANRVLNPLTQMGLIEFIRRPRPGHYRLRRKPDRS